MEDNPRDRQESWAALRREAEEGAAWLGEEVTGHLTVDAASAREGCCTGATRAKIVEHRERMMGRLLEEGLLHHQNQETRPVWSWPERDKLSSQWLLSLPGQDSSLTSDEFTQCVEALLCLPSTACSDVIGEKVGRVRVDRFGDNVVAATLRGDGWRTRHDQVSLHKWAGTEVECEVFNLFSFSFHSTASPDWRLGGRGRDWCRTSGYGSHELRVGVVTRHWC